MATDPPRRPSPQLVLVNQAIPVGHVSATSGHRPEPLASFPQNALRHRPAIAVRYAGGTAGDRRRPSQTASGQRTRIQEVQKQWESIKADLPPQLTRKHIGMISLGGVIGTGLFLGSGAALHNGGPVGALLGYCVMGSVVYCLCVSMGEMIAFLPNVGGIVGLADLYVDPALGFSMGWAAWYNWSITLPTEITAAVVVVGLWNDYQDKSSDTEKVRVSNAALCAIFLSAAIFINCFSSRVYGQAEYYSSGVKVFTIVSIIVISIFIDLGVGARPFVGFKHWGSPFAGDYYGVKGAGGQFLGFWAVLMQASFSFFGSEVPGIAAGEVIDATRNVPRALRRVWLRISLFYIGGIFCAGLLVPWDDKQLTEARLSGTVSSSPFVIAFENAKIWSGAKHLLNVAVLLSAWSAAASDIYISSRFLFFLARRRHAPQIFESLFRYPRLPDAEGAQASGDESDEGGEYGELADEGADDEGMWNGTPAPAQYFDKPDDDGKTSDHTPDTTTEHWPWREGVSVTIIPVADLDTPMEDDSLIGGPARYSEGTQGSFHLPIGEDDVSAMSHTSATPSFNLPGRSNVPATGTPDSPHRDVEQGGEPAGTKQQPWFVLPLYAVLGSASVGLLSFLGSSGQGNGGSGGARMVFNWLSAAASIASLLSWAATLFTYIRWYRGTVYAWDKHIGKYNKYKGQEVSDEAQDIWSKEILKARTVIAQIERIKKDRHPGQPYLAWWAFGVCVVILCTDGWYVFLHTGWRIADIPSKLQPSWKPCMTPPGHISVFLTSYLPVPIFLLLTFGYKLINQSKMIKLEDMDFSRGNVTDMPPQEEEPPKNVWTRFTGWLLLV